MRYSCVFIVKSYYKRTKFLTNLIKSVCIKMVNIFIKNNDNLMYINISKLHLIRFIVKFKLIKIFIIFISSREIFFDKNGGTLFYRVWWGLQPSCLLYCCYTYTSILFFFQFAFVNNATDTPTLLFYFIIHEMRVYNITYTTGL